MRTSIDKQPSGRFRARYYSPETKKWYPRTFEFEREAKRWLAEVLTKREAGAWTAPDAGRITFAQWGEEFWASENHLSAKSKHDQLKQYRKHILPVWGDRQLGSITTRQVIAWSADLTTSTTAGLAPNSVSIIYSIFSKMIRAAVEARLIPVSPMPPNRRQLPKITKPRVRVLEDDEIDRLATAVKPRFRALVLCMAYGGFRLGEMAALRRGSVDLERGTISVIDTQWDMDGRIEYDHGPKTDNSRRTVELPDEIATELSNHVATYVSDQDLRSLVFTSQRGLDLRAGNFRKLIWIPAVDAAGLAPLRPHELRHTAISTWLAEGASVALVAARAGDTVGTITSTYAHVLPSDEARLMARLGARRRSAVQSPVAVGGATVVPLDPTRRRKI